MFTAVVVTEDNTLGLALKELAAISEQVSVAKIVERFPERVLEVMRVLNYYVPDLMFVDLEDAERSLELIKHSLGHAPNVAVVGLASRLSPSSRQSFQEAGLSTFLNLPLSLEGFEQSVFAAIHKLRSGVSAKLSVFLPAKAGSGSSTVAVNAAGILASLRKKVLVIEADLHSGVISTLLNVSPSGSVLRALADASSMTDATWLQYIVPAFGFDLLLADTSNPRPLPSWVDYHQLLRFVLERYDHVVVDLPEVINSATEELVRSACNVLVVCTPEMLPLTLAVRRLEKLEHIPAERIHVVVNRWQPADVEVAFLEEFLNRKVASLLPNDYKSVNKAVLAGALVPVESDLGKSIARLAKHLIGIDEPEPQQPEPKGLSWFKQKWTAIHSN